MARPTKSENLKKLPPALMAFRSVTVPQAAALVDCHIDFFRKNFTHLIYRLSDDGDGRHERVRLSDVLALGQPKG